jgi:Rhamnogalacturonan lyase B, N-terminal
MRDRNEGGSGGPFYRCLLNQFSEDQEIAYIVNYGEAQTEPFRTGRPELLRARVHRWPPGENADA